jgi:eukaryotic translation initiation factor 2C
MALKQPQLSVVNVGTRENPTYLPPEVCLVMPGQSADSKLEPSQTQQMIKFAVRKPGANADSIARDGLNIVGLTGNNAFLVHVPPPPLECIAVTDSLCRAASALKSTPT